MVNNVNIVIFCSNNIGIGLVLETSEINNSYVLAPESPLSVVMTTMRVNIKKYRNYLQLVFYIVKLNAYMKSLVFFK